ncbi:hypothetical protein Tco_1207392 [Tanacetum coccineum]
MPRNQLALTRPRLNASIAITHGTLLESVDQKEIKKAEEETQGTLDIEQKTMGGDLENRRNLKIWIDHLGLWHLCFAHLSNTSAVVTTVTTAAFLASFEDRVSRF